VFVWINPSKLVEPDPFDGTKDRISAPLGAEVFVIVDNDELIKNSNNKYF